MEENKDNIAYQELCYLGGVFNQPETIPDMVQTLATYNWADLANQEFFEFLGSAIKDGIALEASQLPLYGFKNLNKHHWGVIASDAPYTANMAFLRKQLLKRKKLADIKKVVIAINAKVKSNKEPEISDVSELANLLTDQTEIQTSFRGDEILQLSADSVEAILNGEDPGFRFGFEKFDSMCGGFRPGELNIIAARPGVGKTAFAINLALKATQAGKKVLFISLEMSALAMGSRSASMLAGVPSQMIKNPNLIDEEKRDAFLERFVSAQRNYHKNLSENFRLLTKLETIDVLPMKLKQYQMEGFKPDFIFVDYLGLLNSNSKHQNREREVSHFTGLMKRLSLSEDICFVALSQLNRSLENKEIPIPHLHHLRDSGSVEQDADRVIMLYDEAKHDPQIMNQDLHKIFIRKNREGSLGEISFNFKKQNMRFVEI